jgi:hypothetical protein
VHTIRPTDLLHPSAAPRFETLKGFVIYVPKCSSLSQTVEGEYNLSNETESVSVVLLATCSGLSEKPSSGNENSRGKKIKYNTLE